MMIALSTAASSIAAVSPLMLSDRLLTLAQDADRAGFRGAAEHLLGLASDVLEPAPVRAAHRRAQPRYSA
ncbi:MAG TPA: hypothetical protein VGG99_19115 [Acetobacteraceae bacterium]|jgi:hypothetical protein